MKEDATWNVGEERDDGALLWSGLPPQPLKGDSKKPTVGLCLWKEQRDRKKDTLRGMITIICPQSPPCVGMYSGNKTKVPWLSAEQGFDPTMSVLRVCRIPEKTFLRFHMKTNVKYGDKYFWKKKKKESQQKILKSTNEEQPFRGPVFWCRQCDGCQVHLPNRSDPVFNESTGKAVCLQVASVKAFSKPLFQRAEEFGHL